MKAFLEKGDEAGIGLVINPEVWGETEGENSLILWMDCGIGCEVGVWAGDERGGEPMGPNPKSPEPF